MIERLRKHAPWLLIGACAVLAVVGLFFRADSGPESWPLFYPILGSLAVIVPVALVRLLAPVLRMGGEDKHAD
ncbi:MULTISPECIES: hypothetical protein [unclassified Wenzhouxiangella]|uniref:hypothetical protein n=1 Tax=unclassified Wenzhouxiangella TaxID=2613841 RepID=UPI000E326995|nr:MULTISPECIES: hypothetical protein [unclassified Wenzhouxiangella]RFF28392.1 hypothetical protein DZK25_02310 [Wenzhouxiangella sp. 15181]RFP69908.1 hypothetical protein DZK26_01410 [Wenzhouxiangella sp. 15190]